MALYLDHVFITCDSGAPEADALIGHGLLEGSGNVHPGQGTANRRFFFSNFMLELLWVCNADEAASAAAEPAQLWQRWTGRSTGASRLGLLYGGAPPAHVPTRAYQPAYLPPGRAIEAAHRVLARLPEVAVERPGAAAGAKSGERSRGDGGQVIDRLGRAPAQPWPGRSPTQPRGKKCGTVTPAPFVGVQWAD